MFSIDVKSRIPIYEQLKNRTLELIAMELLVPNEKMPSVRSLARDLGVNPNTIQKAYQDMERDEILYTITGKGSFVSENPQRATLVKRVIAKLHVAATEAKNFGVSREEALACVEETYQGGETA